jgi:hypothetical protein
MSGKIINAIIYRRVKGGMTDKVPASWSSFDRQPLHVSCTIDRYQAADSLQMEYALRYLSLLRHDQGYTHHKRTKLAKITGNTHHTWQFVKGDAVETIEWRTT